MYGAGVIRPSSSARQAKVKLGPALGTASTASSGGSAETHFVLPPNVNGRSRGTLTVGFGNFGTDLTGSAEEGKAPANGLRWNGTKVYVSVDLQLVWWGQQSSIATPVATLHWEQGSSKRAIESNHIRYEVRTSAELFRRYLKSCEPIRVRLVSTRTQSLIGTAKVQVPGQIINFRDTCDQTTAQACGEVLSVRGFRLGELFLQLTLSLDRKERPTVGASTAPKESQLNEGKENAKMLRVEQRAPVSSFPAQTRTALAVEGKPAPLHESSQRPLTGGSMQANVRMVKKFTTLDAGSRRKILDYLTGKPLDDDGEGRSELSALSDIRSISPAESMLEALARYDAAPQPRKRTYLQAVDCVRVLVENLKLTRAGQKEIQHRVQRDLTLPAFAVKMKLSRNPTTTKLKFLSSSISSDGAEVSFEAEPQTARFSLTGSKAIDNDVDDGEAHFEFGIHLVVGSFHKTRSFFLGSALVGVRELLDGHFSCHKRCPVRLASDDILLGTLTVRMELGSRGLHFGPELIDAVLVDKGNVTLESSSDSDSSSYTIIPQEPHFPVHRGCAAHRPRSLGQYSAPAMGCHQYGSFLHGRRECLSHTGCPADSQSAPVKGDCTGGEGNSTATNQQTSSTNTSGGQEANGDDQSRRDPPSAMETDPSPPAVPEHPKLLHGLLHLGQLKPNRMEAEGHPGEHFLVCHPFWTDEPSTLTSELCPETGDFNYLRTFAVLPGRSFIERVRNQHMAVELWQKPAAGGTEKLIGVTRLPLHQFYIAFRDAQLAEHLSHAKLPVISIDGWSGIGSPLAAEPCGQLHAVLAIGTESQIEHFKLSRNLLHTSGDAPRSRASNQPSMPAHACPPSVVSSSPTRRIYPRSEHKSIQTMSNSNGGGGGGGGGGCGGIGGCAKPPPTLEVANMLSAFIENLAQRLPISSERSTAPASYDNINVITSTTATTTTLNNSNSNGGGPLLDPSSFLPGSPHSQANRPQLRKTADLLDNLQKALAQRPSAAALDGMGLGGCAASLLGVASSPADQTPPAAGASRDGSNLPEPTNSDSAQPTATPAGGKPSEASLSSPVSEQRSAGVVPPDECKVFRVAIEIEQAVNLPKLTISKKYAKRHKNRNVPDTLELEPSAYATFEGYNLKPGLPHTVKSHEGIVYTTHVLERNCAPAWQKRFEVLLPVDLMMNDEKRFILKVWRKAALSDAPKCRLLPAPMEDAVIGFCAIDLSVLLSGMPYILGWYAIMDFSGRCNGQIKVNIHPLEDVQVYKTLDEQLNFQIPLSIDVDCTGGGGSGGLGEAAANSSLSRALKRKFTELEEITERLKARLFDVTGDDEDEDECLDPDDQFERDLNTEADEAEDEDAEWPDPHGDMSNQKRNSQYPNGALTLTTNTSSYSMCASGGGERRSLQERSLTGCSNRAQTTNSGSGGRSQMSSQLQLADLLQTHDIDTLINPALLKNLLNPSTSDSTPPLGEDGEPDADHASATDADMSDESSLDAANGKGVAGCTLPLPPPPADRVKQISSALQRTTLSEATTGEGGRVAPEGEPMKDSNK